MYRLWLSQKSNRHPIMVRCIRIIGNRGFEFLPRPAPSQFDQDQKLVHLEMSVFNVQRVRLLLWHNILRFVPHKLQRQNICHCRLVPQFLGPGETKKLITTLDDWLITEPEPQTRTDKLEYM